MDVLPESVSDSKVCEKCFKKHNFNVKLQNYPKLDDHHPLPPSARTIEHRCNICKSYLISSLKLQEHLIEHSFKGCEDRGYSCYICSSVFTAAAGLQMHMEDHGSSAKPYDCNLCPGKFFFRAELENHLIDHENGKVHHVVKDEQHRNNTNINNNTYDQHNNNNNNKDRLVKNEINSSHIIPKEVSTNQEEDEEYIEVEKVVEMSMQKEVDKLQSNDVAKDVASHDAGDEEEVCVDEQITKETE